METQNSVPTENSAETDAHSEPNALEIANQKLAEEKSKYLYLYADFENFKKRSIKERSELIKFGWESVAREILIILDNLDRALEHMPTTVDANWASGLKMVAEHFGATLQRQGVQKIDSLSKPFDPMVHEAVGQQPSETVAAGSVLKVVAEGYNLHGRLLRPAKVVVSSGLTKDKSNPSSSIE